MADADNPLRVLLSEALDLCERALQMDKAEEELAEWQARNPRMTRSATVPMWAQAQYERDLNEWKVRARAALLEGSGG